MEDSTHPSPSFVIYEMCNDSAQLHARLVLGRHWLTSRKKLTAVGMSVTLDIGDEEALARCQPNVVGNLKICDCMDEVLEREEQLVLSLDVIHSFFKV